MQENEVPLAADQAAPQSEAPAAEPATESVPNLTELLRQAELKAEEHHDAWLRAKAETDNVRRRAQEDIAKAHKFAVEKFAADLLAVKDTLEMALSDPNPETMRSGVEMTLKNLVSAFEKASVQEVSPTGERFDPHRHQAISLVDAEQEANTVVAVLQKGYLLADRVLRPALVTVAKPKS